jgi:hypothetical protein
MEIFEVQNQLEKMKENKEQYRLQYEKIKNELIRMRKVQDQEKENEIQRQTHELDNLKLQIQSQQIAAQEKQTIAQLKSQINFLQEKYTLLISFSK